MQIGVFLPTTNNGWFISKNSPQFMPSFKLNAHVIAEAEKYGMEFALAMSKLHGFGGETKYWDHSLDSMTLISALAVQSKSIQLYATAPVLTLNPAITARMASTISDVSGGRLGLNIVAGWQKAEYAQMGVWPGQDHFASRYDYCGEYVSVIRELLSSGTSDFKGRFFQMEECQLGPLPQADVPVVCAGQSPSGLAFAAKHGDYNFCAAFGTNNPRSHEKTIAMLREETAKTGRKVGTYVLCVVMMAETDEEAFARWEHYKDGADYKALEWVAEQAGLNANKEKNSVVANLGLQDGAIVMNVGRVIGSYQTVARILDEMGEVEGTNGVMLSFEDHLTDLAVFGEKVQPLMKSRADVVQHLGSKAA